VFDSSLVIRAVYGRVSFLFPGDLEGAGEEALLARGARLDCDVIKVPHHGSPTSSSPEFVARAHPAVAVVSCGTRELYGLPSEEVLERYTARGAVVMRTSVSGAILIRTDGSALTALPYLTPGRAFRLRPAARGSTLVTPRP
jgi:competence protein ComEC